MITDASREPWTPLDGGCDCRTVRYRLLERPLFVHCCHCRWCQRETGASFALNAMIESAFVEVLGTAPELVPTPSESGRGQPIARCPRCRVAVWSHYAGAGPLVSFVRVGTLDEPDRLPPEVHIFTASKQPWVLLPPGVPAFAEYYERETLWPAESLRRRERLLPQIQAWQAAHPAERAPPTSREGNPVSLHIVRLGTPRAADEGLRLGTVRRPPRGVPKARFASDDWYDLWLPLLAPSVETMKAGQAAETDAQWRGFVKRYRREMAAPEAAQAIALLAAMSRRTNLAVGCYCEHESRCHRSVLRALLVEAGAELAA